MNMTITITVSEALEFTKHVQPKSVHLKGQYLHHWPRHKTQLPEFEFVFYSDKMIGANSNNIVQVELQDFRHQIQRLERLDDIQNRLIHQFTPKK